MKTPPRLLLATRNPAKLAEIRQILHDWPLQVIGLGSVLAQPLPEEDGIEIHATFADNALAKARFFAEHTGLPALADDSGIAIHALAGRPGVQSRRFAETRGWRVDPAAVELHERDRTFAEVDRDELNNRLALEALEARAGGERGAHFACAAAFARPDAPRALLALGTCSGRIATEAVGEQGFGYDPIFFLPELGRTFGQVDARTKHRYSHRARAFRAMAGLLEGPLGMARKEH